MHPIPGSVTKNGNPIPEDPLADCFMDISGFYEIEPEEEKMKTENEHEYHFISREHEVDYSRIVKEAPPRTPFILVEDQNRAHKTRGWILFVHEQVLAVGGLLDNISLAGEKVSPDWGVDKFQGKRFEGYRLRSAPGEFPKRIRPQIERLKARMSERDTKTIVRYL